MSKPIVSIILVNYNQRACTLDCLESIYALHYEAIEIIVVDNNSEDNERLQQALVPNVKLIQSEKNLGFAGGNNLGIAQSKGDYVLLANNDTILTPMVVHELLSVFEANPKAGIVSPKILFHNSGEVIQYAGTSSINPLTCRGNTTGYGQLDDRRFNYIRKTSLAHGACMMIKREVLETVGYLPEIYFLYYEEYDFCEAAKRKGYEIFYTGLTHIYHKESMTVGKFSPLKSYYMARNRVLFSIRNFSTFSKTVSLVYFYLLAFPKNVLKALSRRQFTNALATIKGAFFQRR